MNRADFRDIIEKVAKRESLTYSEIADASGVSRANISVIMNQDPEKEVSRKVYQRIADKFPSYFELEDEIQNKTNKYDKNATIQKKPPRENGVAVDVGAVLVKMEASIDVMVSVLAEILASQKGQVSTLVLKELEKAVGARIDFLEQRRSEA